MITENEIYIGIVLARLTNGLDRPLVVSPLPELGNSFFRLGARAGLYVKYSQSRLPPWSFTFTGDQRSRIKKLSDACANVVVCLVCERTGLVGLSLGDLAELIGEFDTDLQQASISVTRRPRQQYSVRGSVRNLKRKVAENDLITWVAESLEASTLIGKKIA